MKEEIENNFETEENENKEREAIAKLEEWKSFCEAQQNVLEIITNYLSLDELTDQSSPSQNPLNLP